MTESYHDMPEGNSMTNEQLAVLLRTYQSALDSEIETLRDKLPETMANTSKVMGFHYVEYPDLDGLYTLRERIELDIDTLSEGAS